MRGWQVNPAALLAYVPGALSLAELLIRATLQRHDPAVTPAQADAYAAAAVARIRLARDLAKARRRG